MDHQISPWWRDAVTYQIYPRSFVDADGDGVGDLAGITSRLPYLKELGVDAVWLSPFYPSGGVDGGYDVADYCNVDPTFGSLNDFDALISAAHDLDLKVVIDVVPNHCSTDHPLFQRALDATPGSAERHWFLFQDGKGAAGANPPNNWTSVFGGPSWTRVPGKEDAASQWYYHLFDPGQPDFNWRNPAVVDFFEGVFRFWLDRGVDGFRIDVSDALIKDSTWRDTRDGTPRIHNDASSPIHPIYRRLRKVLDEYPGDRMAVLETGAPDDVVALLLRPDQMQQAFNLRFLKQPWQARDLADAIDNSMKALGAAGASPTWVSDNHDNPRTVTRYATDQRLQGEYVPEVVTGATRAAADGWHRARVMLMLVLSLPGSAYIYQGQELGLPEVTDLPDEVLTDPVFHRSQGKQRGRDGCRVPLPWLARRDSQDAAAFGFSPRGAKSPWLPQPEQWADLAVSEQQLDDGSMYHWTRLLLQLRKTYPALGRGRFSWVVDPKDTEDTPVVRFRLVKEGTPSSSVIEVVANLGPAPYPLPAGQVLASSRPVADHLPQDTGAIILVQDV